MVVLGMEGSLGHVMVWECWGWRGVYARASCGNAGEGEEFLPQVGVVVLEREGSLGHRIEW